MLTGAAVEAFVLAELRANGFEDTRTSHGYVFQHLVSGSPTVSELAGKLGITQQGASKTVAELERFGYVHRVPDHLDARVTRVHLSDRGRAVIEQARGVRDRLQRELDDDLALRSGLERLLELVGGASAVRARSAAPPDSIDLN